MEHTHFIIEHLGFGNVGTACALILKDIKAIMIFAKCNKAKQ